MQFYLLDLERTIGTGMAFYWKQNKRGYTQMIAEAGLYSGTDANRIIVEDRDNRTVIVPKSVVDKILIESN